MLLLLLMKLLVIYLAVNVFGHQSYNLIMKLIWQVVSHAVKQDKS